MYKKLVDNYKFFIHFSCFELGYFLFITNEFNRLKTYMIAIDTSNLFSNLLFQFHQI